VVGRSASSRARRGLFRLPKAPQRARNQHTVSSPRCDLSRGTCPRHNRVRALLMAREARNGRRTRRPNAPLGVPATIMPTGRQRSRRSAFPQRQMRSMTRPRQWAGRAEPSGRATRGVAMMKSAEARQSDDLGGWMRLRLHDSHRGRILLRGQVRAVVEVVRGEAG